MKNINWILVALFVIASTTLSGCDRAADYPTVSGKVTADGEPIANVQVVFSPLVVGENHSPGPFSVGVSDNNGKYVLQTRNGDDGAMLGKHTVGFAWADIDIDALPILETELKEVAGDSTKEADVKKRIDELNKKLENRPDLEGKAFEFEVLAVGTSDANFDLTDVVQVEPENSPESTE